MDELLAAVAAFLAIANPIEPGRCPDELNDAIDALQAAFDAAVL